MLYCSSLIIITSSLTKKKRIKLKIKIFQKLKYVLVGCLFLPIFKFSMFCFKFLFLTMCVLCFFFSSFKFSIYLFWFKKRPHEAWAPNLARISTQKYASLNDWWSWTSHSCRSNFWIRAISLTLLMIGRVDL